MENTSDGTISVMDLGDGARQLIMRDQADQMSMTAHLNAETALEVAHKLLPAPGVRSVSITNDMINVLGGAYTLASVTKIRKLLRHAGIDAELHPLEVEEARNLRHQAKGLQDMADRLDGGNG